MAVLVAFVLAGTVYAGEKCCGAGKEAKDKESCAVKKAGKDACCKDKEEANEQAEAPKTIKGCEKMIADKTAELEKAEEGKKGEIQKEIDQLKEVLKDMKEFKKSNKEE